MAALPQSSIGTKHSNLIRGDAAATHSSERSRADKPRKPYPDFPGCMSGFACAWRDPFSLCGNSGLGRSTLELPSWSFFQVVTRPSEYGHETLHEACSHASFPDHFVPEKLTWAEENQWNKTLVRLSSETALHRMVRRLASSASPKRQSTRPLGSGTIAAVVLRGPCS